MMRLILFILMLAQSGLAAETPGMVPHRPAASATSSDRFACPAIMPAVVNGIGGDAGSVPGVVTGKYVHQADNLVDLAFVEDPEIIQTTDNHPFWSADREQFQPLHDFVPGDRLQACCGIMTIKSITPRGPPELVYNLEVHGEHVFHVGQAGVLVHNCGGGAPSSVAKQPTYVVGRQVDTAVAKDWAGHSVLDIPDWTLAKNDAWINNIVDTRGTVYLGSPQTRATLWDVKNTRPSVFARELEQLKNAGYTQVGDYMYPPVLK